MQTTTIIIIAVVAILIFVLVGLYNNLVRLRNNRENAFANVDVQLKQRHDMVSQLVGAVKGIMAHERGVLENVTKARAAAMGAGTINDKIEAEKELSSALNNLRVSIEAYPEIQTNHNVLELQKEIADLENKLAASRRFFNATTKELNTACQTFPSVLIASMFGFHKEPMFEVSQTERVVLDKAPEVNLV